MVRYTEWQKKIGILMNGYVLRESPTLYYLCECLQETGYQVEIFINRHEPLDAETYQQICVPVISPEQVPTSLLSSVAEEPPSRKRSLAQYVYRTMLNAWGACLPYHLRFAFFSWYYGKVSPNRSYFAFLRKQAWDTFALLFVVEPEGLDSYYRAGLSVPYIYLSMEFNNLSFEKTSPGERYLKMIEQRYIPQARFSIIQDAERERIFRQDTGLPTSHKIRHLPVSARGSVYTDKSRYFREKFQIPEEKRIVLYAGSIFPWTDLLELIPVVAEWDEKFVLIIHGGKINQAYLVQLHTAANGSARIFFSTDWIPYDRLDAVMSSADIGIAVYGDSTLNTQLTVHASGKKAMSLRVGLPIITNNFEGVQAFFQHTGCGQGFDSYQQIGQLLCTIDADYEQYRANAFRTFQDYYCFDTHFHKLLPYLQPLLPVTKME